MSFDMSKCKKRDELVLRNGKVVVYLCVAGDLHVVYKRPHNDFEDGYLFVDNDGRVDGYPCNNPYDVVGFYEEDISDENWQEGV